MSDKKPKLVWRRGIASYKNKMGVTIWKIRFRVPIEPGSRVTEQKTETLVNCDNKTMAEKVLAKRQGDVFDGIYRPRATEAPPTVAELVTEWLKLKADLKSHRFYVSAFDLHLLPFFGKMYVTHVNSDDCDRYRLERKAEGAKPATVRNELRYFGSFMSWVQLRKKLRTDNPLSGVAFGYIDNERQRVLSPAERERLITQVNDLDGFLRPLFWVLYYTGARLGSALALKWSDVGFEHGWIELRQTKSGRTVRPLMGPQLAAELELWRGKRSVGEWVFPSRRRGRHLTIAGVRKPWIELCEAAQISDLHRHDLRHNLVSTFSALGLSAKATMQQSGHRTLNMHNRYDHPDAQAIRTAIKAMEAISQRSQTSAQQSEPVRTTGQETPTDIDQ